MSNTEPIYAHDCNSCRFIGHHTFHNETYDMYICGGMGSKDWVDIVCRYGNNGPEYMSASHLNNFNDIEKYRRCGTKDGDICMILYGYPTYHAFLRWQELIRSGQWQKF